MEIEFVGIVNPNLKAKDATKLAKIKFLKSHPYVVEAGLKADRRRVLLTVSVNEKATGEFILRMNEFFSKLKKEGYVVDFKMNVLNGSKEHNQPLVNTII